MLPSYAPKCPNHGCPLDGLPFPMQAKGIGMCQVSGCPFEYEIDLDIQDEEEVLDKFGNKTTIKKWKVTGEEV